MGVKMDNSALNPEAPSINKEVEYAVWRYQKMESNLDLLMKALRQQYKAMNEVNQRKLEVN